MDQLYNFSYYIRYGLAEIGLFFDMVGVVLIYIFRFQKGPRLEPTSVLLLESSGKSPEEQDEKVEAEQQMQPVALDPA